MAARVTSRGFHGVIILRAPLPPVRRVESAWRLIGVGAEDEIDITGDLALLVGVNQVYDITKRAYRSGAPCCIMRRIGLAAR
jgi:hypothetical protein